jgi:hypothetical protein
LVEQRFLVPQVGGSSPPVPAKSPEKSKQYQGRMPPLCITREATGALCRTDCRTDCRTWSRAGRPRGLLAEPCAPGATLPCSALSLAPWRRLSVPPPAAEEARGFRRARIPVAVAANKRPARGDEAGRRPDRRDGAGRDRDHVAVHGAGADPGGGGAAALEEGHSLDEATREIRDRRFAGAGLAERRTSLPSPVCAGLTSGARWQWDEAEAVRLYLTR